MTSVVEIALNDKDIQDILALKVVDCFVTLPSGEIVLVRMAHSQLQVERPKNGPDQSK